MVVRTVILSFVKCSVDLVVLSFYLHVTEKNCSVQLNLDRLLARMWEEMGLVRVYTKPQGQQPDFTDPVVLSTVRSLPHYAFFHLLLFHGAGGNNLSDSLFCAIRIEVDAQLKTSAIISIEACSKM